ncbi:MAG: sigma-70 family RNA polymerase sigma factor [Planctomycetes bacterium]|nr:sigma-70 family RNA polymerase sigma factor [Planctomycetota bacterium]NBY03499.1 sigma-70 family RNA polymerase sigma factor [Planctomycetota bacterium]
MNSLDDNTLIRLVLEGKTSAFDVIVRRYNTKVYSLAYRLLNSVEDAEDVAQDTFSQAFKGLGSFRGNSKFYTWLFRITYNLAISQRRKRKPALSLNSQTDSQGEITLPSDDAGPMKNMEDEEGKTLMDKALGLLSLDHRAGLVLKEIEGFSYEEIALSLGVPVGTVRSRLHRARLELRAILEKLDKERADL